MQIKNINNSNHCCHHSRTERAWYFLWYVPHTPVYTFQTYSVKPLRKQRCEIRYWSTSIQHHWLERSLPARATPMWIHLSPLGKAAVGNMKTFGPALLDDVIRKYVEGDPDSFINRKIVVHSDVEKAKIHPIRFLW